MLPIIHGNDVFLHTINPQYLETFISIYVITNVGSFEQFSFAMKLIKKPDGESTPTSVLPALNHEISPDEWPGVYAELVQAFKLIDRDDDATLNIFKHTNHQLELLQPFFRSDDAQQVRARPVAPTQSVPSQTLLKKRKIQTNDSTSSKVKETSTSKSITPSGDYVELDPKGAFATPVEISPKEEEQLADLIGEGIRYEVDRRLTNIVSCHYKKWIGVHLDSLKAGMRIPLDHFLVDFMNYYGIVPSQVAPNGHRILACFPQICARHQVPYTIDLFNFLHLVKTMGKNCHPSFVIIQSRGLFGKVSGLPDNNRKWRGKFLRVFLKDGVPFKNEWSHRMRKCVPPPETLEIKDAVEKISSECYSWDNYHSPEALAAAHLPPPMYGVQRQVVPDGHLAMDLDPDLEEFVSAGGKSSFGIDQSKSSRITLKRKSAPSDHHEIDQLPIGPPPSSSSIAPVPSTSLGKRPLGEVEVETEVPGSTLATDREMPRLAEEGPPHVRALVRGTADLPKMFNLLSELGPPPASVVSDTNEEVAAKMAQHLSYVANTSTELFMRCQLYAMKREEESQAFKATMRDLENQLESYRARVAQLEESLKQYPNSDQFRRDAIAHFASHPTEIPGLLSTLCPSEEAALPLFHMFRDDPVISKMLRRVAGWGYHKGKKGMQQNLYRTLEAALRDDWEEVRAVLPDDLTPPGPEPFSKPSTSSIDPSATSSCNQDP
nr:probable calcium-binding protein CML36 [Ipomoea batatas]